MQAHYTSYCTDPIIDIYTFCLSIDPTSGEVWLEITRLPKDMWITELDNKLAEIQKELDKKDDKEKEKV